MAKHDFRLHTIETAPEAWGKQRGALMRGGTLSQAQAESWDRRGDMMAIDGGGDPHDRARRFREAALPHLDDVYAFARYLLRDRADAEDAVQECYLRALRHFDAFRGTEIRPWLFTILRNICRNEFSRRSSVSRMIDCETEADEEAAPLWQEPQASPETEMLHQGDAETIRRLIAQLPEPLHEIIVLREINDLSYREIADVVEVPVSTVMSRLARARSMLRKAWTAAEGMAT